MYSTSTLRSTYQTPEKSVTKLGLCQYINNKGNKIQGNFRSMIGLLDNKV